jgi:hypothetical protein
MGKFCAHLYLVLGLLWLPLLKHLGLTTRRVGLGQHFLGCFMQALEIQLKTGHHILPALEFRFSSLD